MTDATAYCGKAPDGSLALQTCRAALGECWDAVLWLSGYHTRPGAKHRGWDVVPVRVREIVRVGEVLR